MSPAFNRKRTSVFAPVFYPPCAGMVSVIAAAVFVWFAAARADDRTTSPGADDTDIRVLVLHSYHFGFTWTDNISSGIRETFRHCERKVELCFEFMDTRRVSNDEYFDGLEAAYRVKYEGRPVDVIIASDDHAFAFMLERGQRLFPDVPVVFCSVSGYDSAACAGRAMTGLRESIDIKATLDLALRLHPETREVAVVTDLTRTGMALEKKAREVFAEYAPRIAFRYLNDLSFEELDDTVATLRSGTIVFLFIFSKDRRGHVFSHEENLTRMAPHCSVPIYAVWEFYLGHGIVGGRLTNGFDEGRMVGEIARRIIGGEKVDAIPIGISPTRIMFDYNQMARFGIQVSALPEDATVINRPTTFYHRYRTLIWSVALAFIVLGTLVIILGINVVQRRNSQARLAAERERLAVTLRSIGDGVITTDVQGMILFVNRAAEELTGWKQHDAQGKPLAGVFTIVNGMTRETCENPVEKVLATGETVELSNHSLLIARDGTERLIADSGAPIKGRDSVTIGVVLVFRDITEKQKMQEALQRSAKLESLAVLAGGIAHDFNNLLSGIYGFLDLAQEKVRDTEAITYIAQSLATIDRARGLTLQLLTFAKGGAPDRKTGPLFPFVEECARFALSGSNVSCVSDIQEGLWQCSFDRNQIGQVIDNLVINAQQAMPLGGRIDISASNVTIEPNQQGVLRPGHYVKLAFRDSGVGIPQHMLQRIFDPFFTTKTKGHGLGLATCYSILKRHDGTIEAHSEPEKGSIFTLYLPAASASEPSAAGHSQSARHHTGSGTILVMDDEKVIRDLISEMLGSCGYTVACVENGNALLKLFASRRATGEAIKAIVCDLTIQDGMGGKEVIREIRGIDRDIPVFVASGYAEDPVLTDPVRYGFTAGIRKPFLLSEIVDLLDAHLG